jgi:hypothetical protein
MSTPQACVFGTAPKAVEAPEKIFDTVDNCAWVSSPMTTSHFMGKPFLPPRRQERQEKTKTWHAKTQDESANESRYEKTVMPGH